MSPRSALRVAAAITCVTVAATCGDITSLGRAPASRWYKGNTHAHTTESDGDSPPDTVVRWYRDHGYQFLVLSDHNVLTEVASLNALYGLDESFVVIRGEEVSDVFGGTPVHVNGLGIDSVIAPQGGATLSDLLQRDVDAIRARGGVPHINHPNYYSAITPAQLAQVQRTRLFELYNGHPLVANEGGPGVLPLEEAWDQILTSGTMLFGIAVDDAHHFKDPSNPAKAGPGRGWIMVRATDLTTDTILAALERGDFYASTGIELERYLADARGIDLRVRSAAGRVDRISFIGSGGRVLAESIGPRAAYRFRGDEGYVRARVTGSDGSKAWTQPIVP